MTDIDETVAGIKRQHNVFEQLGINPEEAFGYKILEPLIQLRKEECGNSGRLSDCRTNCSDASLPGAGPGRPCHR